MELGTLENEKLAIMVVYRPYKNEKKNKDKFWDTLQKEMQQINHRIIIIQ